MPSVLFVCTANICRSPMAEALFRARLGPAAEGWRAESAGTWAPEGEPAADQAQQVLKTRGLDLGRHRSRSVSRMLIERFNLVLTMERGQKEALRSEFPEYAGRVYLLSEMIGQSHEIWDPVGGSLVDFEATAKELDQILSAGFARISRLAAG